MESIKKKENEAYYERVIMSSLRIGFVGLVLLLSYLIVKPFLVMVVWGIIIAIGIYPIFEKLSKGLGNNKKLASIIITLLILAAIIIPSSIMVESTVTSIQNIASEYEAGNLSVPAPEKSVSEWPIVGTPIYEAWSLASSNLQAALKTFQPQIIEYGSKFVGMISGIGGTILLSLLSIIIAGILLLQAESAERTTHKVFKFLIGKDGEEFTKLTHLTIKSVVQGVLGIAVVQSIAAGLLMVIFGIPAAGLWALIVLVLAIIQLPPMIILLPVVIYGFNVMDTTSAIIFAILSIVISFADTFLKPIFLGRGVDVPMLVILLGAIGGMMLMGIMGLFVGSVILAIAFKIFEALINEEN